MSAKDIFRIDMAVGYLAWALCIATYLWPRLRAMDRVEVHRAIATFNSFRFFGLVFLLPGFVGPNLPQGFAAPVAYGDLATARARNPRTADGARSLPLLAAGLGVQSVRSRRPRHGHGAGGPRGSAVRGRPARGRLRDPHSLCTGAFLDAPPRVLAAAATWARARSVGRRRQCRSPRLNNQDQGVKLSGLRP